MSLVTRVSQCQQLGVIQNSQAIVPVSGALTVAADVVASVATERLRRLRIELENSFTNCTNQKSLELLAEYETKMASAMQYAASGLNSTSLSRYKEQLLDEKTLKNMKLLIEKGGEVERVCEESFCAQISQINQSFPSELEAYVDQTIKQIQEALDIKKRACQEQSKFYLNKMQTLESFVQKTSSIIPLYSIYGESVQQINLQEEILEKNKQDLVSQINALVNPEGLLKELKGKIAGAKRKMEQNQSQCIEHLKQEIRKRLLEAHNRQVSTDLTKSNQLADVFKEVNSLYLDQINSYLDLITKTVNELVASVQESATLSLRLQDMRFIDFTKKSEAISTFLDFQTKKILDVVQAQQQPVISKVIGGNRGQDFDDRGPISRGRIASLKIRSGWILDAIQVTYEDHKKNKVTGVHHGGQGGSYQEIHLPPNERIQKVIVGTEAYHGIEGCPHLQNVIEEVTFHTNTGRVLGPYGGHAAQDGMKYLAHFNRADRMKMEEISYGPNYYLGALIGNADYYISSLGFVFFKDFSPEIKQDVSSRMSAVIKLAEEKQDCKLSVEEQAEIHAAFAQIAYVNLSKQKDPRKILEVSETADASEITKAYRKLSLKYHPDKVPENESYKLPLYKIKLEEVQTAYKALIPDN